jgi:hypothetical protein
VIRDCPAIQVIVGPNGKVDPHWQRWFGDLAREINAAASTDDATTVEPVSLVQGYGIRVTGTGEAATPWVVGLRELADAGTGTSLKKVVRDSYGRISATEDATAADLPFDNTTSGLTATQTQAAIDEVAAKSVTGSWTTIKKTSDETRSSTTTYADDSTLKFSVVSGSTYVVRARIYYTSAGQALKHRLNASGSTSNVFSHLRQTNPGAAYAAGSEFSGAQSGFWFANTTAAAGSGFVDFDATFTATANGTFAWQWAQNVSAATDLTVRKGSYLEYATV